MNKTIKKISLSAASLALLSLGMLGVSVSVSVSANTNHHTHIHIPKYSMKLSTFAYQRRNYRYKFLEWNTRDLGGYPARFWNSKKTGIVKPHLLLRSSRFTHLGHHRQQDLKKLHVTTIIDLRNYSDTNKHLDTGENRSYRNAGHVPNTNIKYVHAPIWRNNAMTHYHPWQNHFYMNYAARSPWAIQQYRKIFHILLTNKGAIAFHCDAGHDRTGVTAALIEGALNVNRPDEFKDYELTNMYHHHKASKRQTNNIHEFYHNINKHYGSMYHYLTHTIGLSNHQLHQLQNKYVQKN